MRIVDTIKEEGPRKFSEGTKILHLSNLPGGPARIPSDPLRGPMYWRFRGERKIVYSDLGLLLSCFGPLLANREPQSVAGISTYITMHVSKNQHSNPCWQSGDNVANKRRILATIKVSED